jgi:YD repeat-containing protein
MTQIQGFIKPSRRSGELGIHSIDHFHFVVPDLSAAEHFYTEFGLDVRQKGNILTIHTHGQPHEWGYIGEGQRKRHSHIDYVPVDFDRPSVDHPTEDSFYAWGLRSLKILCAITRPKVTSSKMRRGR